MAVGPKPKKKWINKVMSKPGAKGGLHKSLGVPAGKTIPLAKVQAAAKQPGKVGAQARLALTLRKMKKKK